MSSIQPLISAHQPVGSAFASPTFGSARDLVPPTPPWSVVTLLSPQTYWPTTTLQTSIPIATVGSSFPLPSSICHSWLIFCKTCGFTELLTADLFWLDNLNQWVVDSRTAAIQTINWHMNFRTKLIELTGSLKRITSFTNWTSLSHLGASIDSSILK